MTDRKLWKVGCSASFCGKFDESVMEDYAVNGIPCAEISFQYDYYDKIQWNKIPQWSKNTGTELWSVHLPFTRTEINIAHPNKFISKVATAFHRNLIDRAGEAGAKVIVIHPSSEPIEDCDRPELLARSAENLGNLVEKAKGYGMQVAVENLPRSCLCNCSSDVVYMLEQNPDLRVCFDTNHLLKEASNHFINAVGNKIITLHVSDYDFIDERHFFPGDGQIDWKKLMADLEAVDYNGPFLYETAQKHEEGRSTLSDIKKNHDWLMTL